MMMSIPAVQPVCIRAGTLIVKQFLWQSQCPGAPSHPSTPATRSGDPEVHCVTSPYLDLEGAGDLAPMLWSGPADY